MQLLLDRSKVENDKNGIGITIRKSSDILIDHILDHTQLFMSADIGVALKSKWCQLQLKKISFLQEREFLQGVNKHLYSRKK